MQITLPKNHILYTSSSDIKQICIPLKEHFGITTFSYVKINPDLSRIHLDTNPEWCEIFYKNLHHYFKSTGVTECNHWESGYTLLHNLDEKECINDAKLFDIGNGVLITNRIGKCTELAYFALSNSLSTNTNITKLINSIQLLNNFITYFKTISCNIIDSAAKSPIILPFLKNINYINKLTYDESIKLKFLSKINYCCSKYNLTKREYDCIISYFKGLSSKQTGKLLNISPKTVDRHFENIKEKLNLCKRSELLRQFPQIISLL